MNTVQSSVLFVVVAHWSNRRRVKIEENRILMEVARTAQNCHHCATCRRRVATVEQALTGTPIVWKWEFLPEGGMWLSLARTPEKDPIAHLQEATGLAIAAT